MQIGEGVLNWLKIYLFYGEMDKFITFPSPPAGERGEARGEG